MASPKVIDAASGLAITISIMIAGLAIMNSIWTNTKLERTLYYRQIEWNRFNYRKIILALCRRLLLDRPLPARNFVVCSHELLAMCVCVCVSNWKANGEWVLSMINRGCLITAN